MIKVLHTADWHIGQLFFEYDRTYEHQHFLNWLLTVLSREQIDVLIVSGDVFDVANPSAAAVRMFYSFLNQATRENAGLQIIVTAGNHDSASRLESPRPLLESTRIHIIGLISRNADGEIDYEALSLPLYGRNGDMEAWCMAVPFLRYGDYPQVPGADDPYADGVSAFYDAHYQHILKKQVGQWPVIALGHLHARNAELTELDKAERLIMGGVECIPAKAFPSGISYVALGHIHKAQKLGGTEHIRYCGSPLPMSFSESNYKHQVIVFELSAEGVGNVQSIEVPLSIPLLRVPARNLPLADALVALEGLPERESGNYHIAPYLEVKIALDGPEPSLRHRIEKALEHKHVRLAKIDVKYINPVEVSGERLTLTADQLLTADPEDIFGRVYIGKYGHSVPADIMSMFKEISRQVMEGNTKE